VITKCEKKKRKKKGPELNGTGQTYLSRSQPGQGKRKKNRKKPK